MPFIGELGESGIAKENAVGTVTAPVRFRRFIPPFNFSTDIAQLIGQGVIGVADLVRKTAQGAAQLKGGKMKYELDLEEVGDDLMASMGTDTLSESAVSLVVSSGAGENDKIDFDIGAGALVATVAAGTYKAGQTQADTGTLCKAIYDAIHAAEAVGTYTVSFARATGLFTITRSAGTFDILWNTGTNKAKSIAGLIGFSTAADATGFLTYTGGTAVAVPFLHTFSRVQSAELPSYTWWQKTGLDYPQHAGCMLSKLEFDVKAKEFVIVDADWLGLKYDGTGVTQSATYSSRQPIKFDMCVVSIAGAPVSNYEDLKITIDNQVAVEHTVGSTNYGTKIYSKGLKVSINLSLVVEDTTEWAKFISGTDTAVKVVMTSTELIKAGFPYTLTLDIPYVAYSAAPRTLAKDLIKIAFTAVGRYNSSNGYTILPSLVNGYGTAY